MKNISEMTPAAYKWHRDQKSGRSSNIIGKMMRKAGMDPKNDAKVVNAWLDAHHDEVVDTISFTSNPLRAIVGLLMKQPEFADWDHDRVEDAAIYFDNSNTNKPTYIGQKETNDEGMTIGTGSTTGLTLEAMIAEAVKKGITSALTEGKKPKTRKITRSQLAEGVRKALRMALNEAGMPGAAMPAPGMGASSTMPPTQEEGLSDGDVTKRGASTFGQVPSPEELQAALDENGGFHADLQGGDYLAFSYALEVAGVGNPNMDTGEGMHAVLTALSNAPPPDQLPDTVDDEDINDPHSHLNKILDSWDARYRGSENIEDRAQGLASSILDHLGWEWV